MDKSLAKKRALLGEDPGTANGKLKRMLMFSLLCQLDLNVCYRCGQSMAVDNYSIEHKLPWQAADDPVTMFYDLDNVGFSHLKCNTAARSYIRTEIHGTNTCYGYGCRCRFCKAAHAKINAGYRR